MAESIQVNAHTPQHVFVSVPWWAFTKSQAFPSVISRKLFSSKFWTYIRNNRTVKCQKHRKHSKHIGNPSFQQSKCVNNCKFTYHITLSTSQRNQKRSFFFFFCPIFHERLRVNQSISLIIKSPQKVCNIMKTIYFWSYLEITCIVLHTTAKCSLCALRCYLNCNNR